MKLDEMISRASDSEYVKSRHGNILVELLKTITGSKTPVSVEGYMKKAESDDFFMFSESPRAATWSQISIRSVRALEYFGREFVPDGICAKVRLTL